MDSRQHSRIAGMKVTIGSKPGSKFSVWGGGIHGFTLQLRPNGKIVQAWRSEDWPKDHYSVAIFSFRKAGKGTRLTFEQYGVPANRYKGISDGWRTYYWEPMKRLLEK
jgi:activator of HSP90 ATPase